MKQRDIIRQMNQWGNERKPFIFLFDFELEKIQAFPLDEMPAEFVYQFSNGITCCESLEIDKPLEWSKQAVNQEAFGKSFQAVLKEINFGNSFLLNLTFPSKVDTNYSLEEIFHASTSVYKFLWKDHFVSFSPETFIKIKNNKIYSYPMKGTIDAEVPDARSVILNNPKEEAEHYTIVDLIRNDLAQVSTQVEVKKFRYIDEVKTQDKTLLQVSSEICGQLADDWQSGVGDLLLRLLPAGSISGAPKKKTVEIIQENELDKRGYYTGIAGVFDGDSVDSCVLIRFIEQRGKQLFFRSGGGITYRSIEQEEYDELIQKIYVPVF